MEPSVPGLLSLVIPAYDEAGRIARTLEAIGAWGRERGAALEVIVVDDGSRDGTPEIAEGVPGTRVIRNSHKGKAHAVRTGMLAARGERVLFSDADLAVPIAEAERLLAAQDEGYDVVIASREGAGARRVGEPWGRHLLGRGFNWLVRIVAVRGIRDTQCGFKLFSREAARDLFGALRLYDESAPELRAAAVTAFDVEVLFLARKLGYRIRELPVEWHYGSESKVRTLADSWRNLMDVLRIRWNDARGRYERVGREPVRDSA